MYIKLFTSGNFIHSDKDVFNLRFNLLHIYNSWKKLYFSIHFKNSSFYICNFAGSFCIELTLFSKELIDIRIPYERFFKKNYKKHSRAVIYTDKDTGKKVIKIVEE